MSTFVCVECLNEDYLQSQFSGRGADECSYCSETRPGVELEELAIYCENAIHSSFSYAVQPDSVIHFGRDPIGSSLYEVLETVLGTEDSSLLADIETELRGRWSDWEDDDPYFENRLDASAQMTADWRRMQQSLLFESRLVNPVVSEVLERVFGDIEQLHTAMERNSAIIVAGPGLLHSSFLRARSFENAAEMIHALKHPELRLGPTPKGLGSAGRMNAKGISVFYGATAAHTAVSEVRPPVGSYVVTAVFDLTRPLRLLNLSDLSSMRPNHSLSYFDPVRRGQAERCAFLQELKDQMLMPVMPNTADQDYLITQAIADFLACHPGLNLDGILYPSVQTPKNSSPGQNVVLFHKASRVEKTDDGDALEHVQLWESDENRWYFMPEIFEAKPSEPVPPSLQDLSAPLPALRLDRTQISIHKIDGVLFNYQTNSVSHVPWSEEPMYYGRR